jgi:hypothetical protein
MFAMPKIYGLIDPLTGELRWVGKTSKKYVSSRMTYHRAAARGYRRACGCSAWLRSLLDQGLDAKVIVLEETQEWIEAECFWIAYARFIGCRLLNISDGGDGVKGFKPSLAMRRNSSRAGMGREVTAETRRKLSSMFKNRVVSEKTKSKIRAARARQVITEETWAKVSRALKGRKKPPRSPQHSLAISLAKRGKKQTAESNLKRSITQTGRKLSEDHKQRIRDGWAARRLRRGA